MPADRRLGFGLGAKDGRPGGEAFAAKAQPSEASVRGGSLYFVTGTLLENSMELTRLADYPLSSDTLALIADVSSLAIKVNEFRPMTPELVKSVHEKLFPDRVYSSNAIEGNTLTLRETIQILTTGYVDSKRRREGTEAKNLGDAVRHLESILLPDIRPFTVDKLLGLHRVLMSGLDSGAGKFRQERVMIAGAAHQPPRDELIPQLVDQMLSDLAASQRHDAVKAAAWAHWAIARIHPFVDGNGRTARLWQDLVLLRADLAPAIIRLQDRDQNGYYDALATADRGDLNPLTQLIAQRIAATLDKYLAAQQQATDLEDWAQNITGEANTRLAERRMVDYLRWSRIMESLRNDFQRCAAKITETGNEVQFREFPLIDEGGWENIRNGIGVRRTWFFSLTFRMGGSPVRYYFFFGKHFWKSADTDTDRSEPRVALLVSEQSSTEEAQILYDQVDSPLSLREVFVVDTALIAVHANQTANDGEGFEYRRHAIGLDLAKNFIKEVFLRRLT